MDQSVKSVTDHMARQSGPQPGHPTAFGVSATTAPPTDPQITMQRADEVNAILRMLNTAHTSAVVLTGNPGAGKSTLAALLFQRFQQAKHSRSPAPRHLVWLTLGAYSTLPDIIATMLSGINMQDPGLFMLKPEQQVAMLLDALRRSNEDAFIVLDQFELLLYPETAQGIAGRGVLPIFLEMLQSDLGGSRVLLTNYTSLFDEQKIQNSRVRSYLVSRISLPEGVALLQRRGIPGSPEELSFVWQRTLGHVFSLILFNALLHLSGISLSYLLISPDYQPMWIGDVNGNLLASVYGILNPLQRAIAHVLSLFNEPAPLEGIVMTISGNPPGKLSSPYAAEAFEQEISKLVLVGLVLPIRNTAGIASYTVHPLLRQYVLEHFLEDEKQQVSPNSAPLPVVKPSQVAPDKAKAQRIALAAGHAQVAIYYCYLIDTRCLPREQRKRLQDIAPIIEAIRHLCQGGQWQQACDLLFKLGLHECMVQWGAWSTLIGLYTAMLPPFGVLQRHDEALVTAHVAMLYGRVGGCQQSKTYFEQALKIHREIDDLRGEAATLTNQGELQRMSGEQEQAKKTLERALELNARRPDSNLRSILLHNLGLLAHQKKDYARASTYYVESLKLACDLGQKQNTGLILTNLGMLLYEQHQLYEALALLLAASQLRYELADPTSAMLERFLEAIEQKVGTQAYINTCERALQIQPDVFSRFALPDVRQ